MGDRKLIAMIPARLGSKRIPRKNIRYLADKPLIRYPIELAVQCGRFDSIWVNTENRDLGRAAESMGASFHERPVELSGDNATNREFTYEFLQKHPCDYIVMMNTTSPLLRLETVNAFLDYLEASDFDTIVSVSAEKEETFYRGEPLNFSLDKKVNSQFLEPTEAIVWSMTAWKAATFMRLQEKGENPVFGGKLGRFVIPKDESCDLDTEEDWNIAEGILTARNYKSEARYMELDSQIRKV